MALLQGFLLCMLVAIFCALLFTENCALLFSDYRCLLGEKYKEIIQRLVNAGLLEENPKWRFNLGGNNNHTKAYALPKWMINGDKIYRLIKVSNRKSIQNMLARFNNLRVSSSSNTIWRDVMIATSHKMLLHDTPECCIEVQKHIDKINYKSKFKLNISAKELIEIFNSCPLDQSIIDLFGYRVHTKITNLPKKLRTFLYFDERADEELGCVDVVNSQPVFMSIATPTVVQKFTPELTEATGIVAKYQSNTDVISFREICANGLIYERIQEYFLNHGETITRDQAKPICYTAFFGNYNFFELGRLKKKCKVLAYEFLKTEYAGMYQFFKELKMNKWCENSFGKQKQHANNCMLAQRLESSIFYTIIVPAIWEAGYRDFSTIHDSIIAPVSDLDAIREIMLKEFEKLNISLKLAA
jgi:hypothetical protein